MAYELYTIRQFRDALYSDKRDIISEEQLKIVEVEYADTAELYETEEFAQSSYIQFVFNRIKFIDNFIELQLLFLKEFDIAYKPAFEKLKKYGHYLKWVDKEDFLKRIEDIKSREDIYESILEESIKNLNDFRKTKKTSKKQTVKESRNSFIRTVNSLGKEGYSINWDSTTVEELALMIKQQKDLVKQQ